MGDPAASDGSVLVPRRILQEVLADGCCPLHLRLRFARLLAKGVGDDACGQNGRVNSVADTCDSDCAPAGLAGEVAGTCGNVATKGFGQVQAEHRPASTCGLYLASDCEPFAALDSRCLAAVAMYLPLAEVLAMRACSREPLQWAMERGADDNGSRRRVYDRIQARLSMRRVADLTAGTQDESVFETRMRNLADEALRSRMETEMQEALRHMEEQIHQFQAEVDRRFEEQERNVRQMVEERVQQELDAILASEVVKVQAMVEERVRERVGATFRREVRETVRELQAKLDHLAEENELLRDAFAEANHRAKCLFWLVRPPPMQIATMAAVVGVTRVGRTWPAMLSFRRRAELAGCWHPGLERASTQRCESRQQDPLQ